MKKTIFILVALPLISYTSSFDFCEKSFLNSSTNNKYENHKEFINNYVLLVLDNKRYNQNNFNLKSNECKRANKIKQMITEYINDESKRVYEDVFISILEENNKIFNECYFPRSHEVGFFWGFVEDNVVIDAKDNRKAMKLLIDLCFLYRNNAEFSVELFAFAIINATINNPTLFVKELAGRSQSEIKLCINKLKYLKTYDDIVKIKTEIEEIKEPEYQEVVNKIKAILPD